MDAIVLGQDNIISGAGEKISPGNQTVGFEKLFFRKIDIWANLFS